MYATIAIDTSGDWLKELWLAALIGAVASLVAELLLTRGSAGDTGAIELPHGVDGGHWFDLGSLAAIPTGVLAAVIAAFALTPVQEVVKNGVTTRTLEVDKLVVVAAVAGLASSSFLTLVQQRFIAVAQNQRLDAALGAALRSFDQIADSAKDTAAGGTHAASVVGASTDEEAKQVVTQIAQPLATQASQAKAAALAAAGSAMR